MAQGEIKVIICGGRDLPESGEESDTYVSRLKELLRELSATLVISGDARGGDRLGERAARELEIPVEYHPAQWSKYGRSAGILRNLEMLANADMTIALPGGRGTAHMSNATLRAKKKLFKVYNPKQQSLFP